MTTDEKRKELAKYILECDDDTLNRVEEAMMPVYEKIVAHTVQGEPLTEKKYTRLLDEASKRVRSGDFITQEDLEIESRNW